MMENDHIRTQRVKVSVAKDGTVKQTLVLETNLTVSEPEWNDLVVAVVAYLKQHDDIDEAEICLPKELS